MAAWQHHRLILPIYTLHDDMIFTIRAFLPTGSMVGNSGKLIVDVNIFRTPVLESYKTQMTLF